MISILNKACVFWVLLMLLSSAGIACGKVIYVDDDGPADYNNIQAAINDANSGDRVIVTDGAYTGDDNQTFLLRLSGWG